MIKKARQAVSVGMNDFQNFDLPIQNVIKSYKSKKAKFRQ
jgi:hypothetical protein